uniref:Bone morphotic protein 15 n=1 Tax=Dromaius novaehollandiae TaxID=8790 RepID=A0A8C4J665_DRONO|nr:bone morphogenetic protein 15 [Dromaius novaehollandiae]
MGSLGPLASLLFLAALLSRELAAKRALPAPGPSLPLLRALQERAPGGRARRVLPATGQPLRYMLDLYRRAADRNGRPRRDRVPGANTVRLVQASSPRGQPWAGRRYAQPLTYRLEARPAAERLLRAVVVYPRSPAPGLLCALQPAAAARPAPLGPPAHRGWAQADVTPYLAAGNSSEAALRLWHVCVRAGGPNDTAALPGEPFLLLYLNDTRAGPQPMGAGLPRSRRAREAPNLAQDLPGYLREQGAEKSDCSLRSFPVSFAQLGWDHWIIAPHRYNPRYCKGACPRLLRYDYHAPNHAVVQNFVHQLVDASVPRPSCVPYRYSPISVLMIEPNGGILYKEYENMIAESCTCR